MLYDHFAGFYSRLKYVSASVSLTYIRTKAESEFKGDHDHEREHDIATPQW